MTSMKISAVSQQLCNTYSSGSRSCSAYRHRPRYCSVLGCVSFSLISYSMLINALILSMRTFFNRRKKLQALMSNHESMNTNIYFRLICLAATNVLLTVLLGSYAVYQKIDTAGLGGQTLSNGYFRCSLVVYEACYGSSTECSTGGNLPSRFIIPDYAIYACRSSYPVEIPKPRKTHRREGGFASSDPFQSLQTTHTLQNIGTTTTQSPDCRDQVSLFHRWLCYISNHSLFISA
jgi:hypothetical protein